MPSLIPSHRSWRKNWKLNHCTRIWRNSRGSTPSPRETSSLTRMRSESFPRSSKWHGRSWPCHRIKSRRKTNRSDQEGRKEGNVLFNDALNTFYLWLYGVRHTVKDHSYNERGNLLLPHGLLFPIGSKGSFICIIPQTG